MKKTLVLVSIICLIGIATAFQFNGQDVAVGTTFNQATLDSKEVTPSAVKLDWSFDKLEFPAGQDYVMFYFDYTAPTNNRDGTYTITNKFARIRYEMTDWRTCRDTNSKAECLVVVKDTVKTSLKNSKQKLVANIQSWQTPTPQETVFNKDDISWGTLE